MPILYRTAYKHSPISGMGLFAEEDIPKGSCWWVFDNQQQGVPCLNAPNLPNLVLTEQSSKKLVEGKTNQELYETLEHTMYYHDGEVILVLRDGAGVVNHSFQPNSQIVYNKQKRCDLLKSVALRDIKAGRLGDLLELWQLPQTIEQLGIRLLEKVHTFKTGLLSLVWNQENRM